MKMIFLLLALVAGTINYNAVASEDLGHAEIRDLVKKGEVLPLESILLQFPEKDYGKLLDLEIEREHGAIVYELEFLRVDGLVIEIEVDARNGAILKQEIED